MRRDEPLHGAFGDVDDRPHPLRVHVQPGEMTAARAPTRFRQRHDVGRRVIVDDLRGGRELDCFAHRQRSENLPKPDHAFEPPVAEELRVVGGRNHPESA